MASRSELATELSSLRAEVEKLRAEDRRARTERDPEPVPPEPEDTPEIATQIEAELARILAPYGIELDDIEDLAAQFRAEMENLPRERPLTAMVGAFALGLLVGRLTK